MNEVSHPVKVSRYHHRLMTGMCLLKAAHSPAPAVPISHPLCGFAATVTSTIRPNVGPAEAPPPQGCRLSRLHKGLSDPLDIVAEKTARLGQLQR